MTIRRPEVVVLIAFALLLAPGITSAQQVVPAPGREAPTEVRLTPGVGPEDVRRVGDWLRAMNGSNLPPKIREEIEKFLKNQKHPNAQQLQEFAEKLRPQLQDGKQFEELQQFLKNSGGLNGLPKPPALPNLGSGVGEQPGRFPSAPPASMKLPKVPPDSGKPESGPIGATASVGEVPGSSPRPDAPMGATATPPPHSPDVPGSQASSSPEQDGRASKQRQVQALTGWWEQNIGPLNETPAVRQLLVELVTGQGGASGEGGLGDLLEGKSASGEKTGLGRVADSLGASDWKLPDLGIGKLDLAPPSGGSVPSVSADSSLGNLSGVGGDSWLPVILLGVFAAVGLVLWWIWPKLRSRASDAPQPIRGLGPWPVDPRTIADREALIQAFEYLSVLQCGTAARTWNHRTIANSLRQAVPAAPEAADPLAELYAVARYTPTSEAFPEPFLTDARQYLCRLAGVKPV